jgi:nicotinate phosphoribosyltransferase
MPPSMLATDGYKFSMAEAGFPLRQETFYYAHRRAGPHYLPVDVASWVQALLPTAPTAEDYDFLGDHGYAMGGAFRAAITQQSLQIEALPKGAWFFDREPAFSITGPSALVSWLEPLVLQLHYRIQIATIAKLTPDLLPAALATVTCETQRRIVEETLESIGVPAPPMTVDSEGYHRHVLDRVRDLVRIVEDPSRLFEVGMRAATCMEQHAIALAACKEAGLTRTSNVALARDLGMVPIGTMGHEHVQRFGSDEDAFRAMRDRHPGPTSFLLDTFSTLHSGLPTAFALMAEDPARHDSVRFDSGDKETQFLIACSMARSRGLAPRFVLEDSFNAELTARFEDLRKLQKLPSENVVYGYGGFIVKAPGDTLTRDRVAAVWKVTQSGSRATMKFGDEAGAGKESIPGRPVLARVFEHGEWSGLVLQDGEPIPRDAVPLTGQTSVPARLRFSNEEVLAFAKAQGEKPAYSPATHDLIDDLRAARATTLSQLWR